MEHESINYTFNSGEELEVGQQNLSLFTFAGQLAMFNHVFIVLPTQRGENPNEVTGMYVFQTHPDYENLQDVIEHYDFPQHRNLIDVAPCDIDAFEHAHFRDVRELDTFPEEWNHGN